MRGFHGTPYNLLCIAQNSGFKIFYFILLCFKYFVVLFQLFYAGYIRIDFNVTWRSKAHKRCCISCLFSSLCIRITIAELLILRFCDIPSISEAEASGKITVINDVTPCRWTPGMNISEKFPSMSSC
jgi:hypothetical protein